MRRIRYAVATSLDGYIAGPEGEADWILMDPAIDFEAFIRRFDAVLMGRRTFGTLSNRVGSGMPGMTTIVVSTTLVPGDVPAGVVLTDRPAETVAALRAAPGRDIWLHGAGSLFRSLLGLGLVDVVEVAVMPVLLGGGVPPLPTPSERAGLQLVNHRVYEATGVVSLEYNVVSSVPA